MINLINNPWFIGIFGGILSGIIVTFISRYLLSRRDRKEYFQKLLSANREILYALRPGISEGLIPEAPVIEALLSATARKYGVDKKDLYNCSEIGQELIKEVMDSSFISMNTKTEYCQKLANIVYPPKEKHILLEKISISKEISLEEYRSKMVATVSMMLGTIAAGVTAYTFLVKKEEPFGIVTGLKTVPFMVMVLGIVVFLFTIAAIGFSFAVKQRTLKNKKYRKKDMDSEDEGPGT